MGAQGSLSCYHFCRGVVIFLAMGRAICAKFLVAASVFAAARGDYNFEDMQCTVAIGECGGQLKCDNLDASKQCVLKQHAGCENNAVFQQAAHDIKDACEKETQCDAACEAEIKKAIKQQVDKKLKELIPKDNSLDMACAVAIGQCGEQLKCNDLDASKQCVIGKNARCTESVVFLTAALEIKDACEKEDQCDADCGAKIKKAIEQEVLAKIQEIAKEMKHDWPPSFGVPPQIVV